MTATRPLLSQQLGQVVGGTTAKVMADELGLRTVADLLHHYPRRYAERGELTRLADLPLDEHVTVVAEIAGARLLPFRRGTRQRLEVHLTDGSGRLGLVFFGRAAHHHKKVLLPGRRGMFAGKVSAFQRTLQLAHPDYQLLDDQDDEGGQEEVAEFAGRPLPIYPACRQLPSWRIEKAVDTVLTSLEADGWQGLADPLPEALRVRHGLIPLAEAFRRVHQPRGRSDVAASRARLKWDEAFVLQVALARRRHAAARLPAVPRPPVADGLRAAFDARLPFELTAGQRRVSEEIFADLAAGHPMHRLLQGEVGSGKTLVALRAMLTVADSGGQSALLAPTEVLAQQHHRSITEMMGDIARGGMTGGTPTAPRRGTRVVLLTGSMGAAARRRALLEVATGQAGIVIGTHALIEDVVRFHDLGLVVVDEQHRFGVEQRDALRAKSERPPHLLVMTATPIPRTVAMTVFGDLETSVLDELPAGRSPISSHVVPAADKPHFLARAWERLREECDAGHQAYVVCPRIGDAAGDGAGDGDDTAAGGDAGEDAGTEPQRPPLAVVDVARELSGGPLTTLRLGTLHGRLPPEVKDETMRAFAAGELDVLVATTVIEVGVNVPNATMMVIMDADRFGVSQLHQLRGRVGRGSAPGLCLLVTEAPGAGAARARLTAVAATQDGFELSRVDLEQRREGDVLGQAQSGGRSSLRLLTVLGDEDVIAQAREAAGTLVARDPELTGAPALRTALDSLLGAGREEYLDKG